MGDLRKLEVIIDDVKIMTHIMYDLPEQYKSIVSNLEDWLNYDINPLTIKSIRDKLSEKYDLMTVRFNTKTSRENENPSTLNINSMEHATIVVHTSTRVLIEHK